MKKLTLLASVVFLTSALSLTAVAQTDQPATSGFAYLVAQDASATTTSATTSRFVLYLPAILFGKPSDFVKKSKMLLFLPGILSCCPPPPPTTTGLNDTGIVAKVGTTGQEDADYGWDATNNDPANGEAGFSFTKLDSSGAALAASATSWVCILDNRTGLVWEAKTNDSGLHDSANAYNWYNPDNTANGGNPGIKNVGYDTDSFVAAVNAAGLCGHNDWRLPTVKELVSIVSYRTIGTTVDANYFANAKSSIYWTASTNAAAPDKAWGVNFANGNADNTIQKSSLNFFSARLVRTAN